MALKPGGPPLPGDGSGDRHMPGGRRPLGPANGGVTEDWGKVILRIKEDLVPIVIKSQGDLKQNSPADLVTEIKKKQKGAWR